MLGRTPDYIVAVKPLQDGVISDHNMTMLMIKEFVHKASRNLMVKPQVMICVPSSVTDIENRAVIEAALSAGARRVYLIKEPIAALLGAGVDISRASGQMVVDIGGGTADVAIVSFNGIAADASVKMAGNKFDEAIIRYFAVNNKLLLGEKSADDAKRLLGCVFQPDINKRMMIKGRNLLRGLPEAIEITQIDLYNALYPCAAEIVATIKTVIELSPPELVGDILESGILLTGGGAMLGGLAELIAAETTAPCRLAENPLECVALGIAKAFDCADSLLDGFDKVSIYKYKS
jgi:rod shape-determining protein MreB